MRTRNQNIPARELGQQLSPGRRSRGRVDVEGHRDLGMLQLDALCMDDIAPKQDFFVPSTKIHSRYVPGMTRQRDGLYAVGDWLGTTKGVPLAGLEVRRRDGLRTLEERLGLFRRFGSDFRRQPKVAFGLRDVDLAFGKTRFPS